MNNIIRKIFFPFIFVFIQIHSVFGMEIAITVDDLPSHGDLPMHFTRMDIVKKMLFVFKKHHIDGVYGFINGNKLTGTEELNVLKEWVKSGHYLGNHTFQHLDLAKTDSRHYISDIKKNGSILSEMMEDKDYHYFRYPYLSEGNTQEKRDLIRKFLFKSGYKNTPVTIDFFEYEWSDPYVRCVNTQDEKSIDWLKETYLDQAKNALIISHELSIMLFNRDIKNILLIHINSFTAEMLDDLLTEYEKQGVKFISLVSALNDEAYQINPNVIRERAYTFLNQVRLSKNMENPRIVSRLYKFLPEDELNRICR